MKVLKITKTREAWASKSLSVIIIVVIILSVLMVSPPLGYPHVSHHQL